MFSLDFLLVSSLLPLLFCTLCSAQTPNFTWAFSDTAQSISSVLPECQSLNIVLSPSTNDSTALGTPPYYFMAFEPGGFSTSSFVGTNPKNLTWQVDHAAGTQVLLSMADANGSPSGMATALYTVTSGQGASCLPSAPSTSLVITPNVTKDLATCEPWGLIARGGNAPYNITLVAVNSPTVTNVTIPQGFDAFTFINTALPNGQIVAAISDSTGQFGKTSQIVNTVGSANNTCPGLSSKFGQSSQMSASTTSHRTSIILAVGLSVGILMGIAGAVIFRRRWISGGQDTAPRTFKYDVINASRTELSSVAPTSNSYRKQPIFDTVRTSHSASSSTSTSRHEIVPYTPSFHDRSYADHQRESVNTPSSHLQEENSHASSHLYEGVPSPVQLTSPNYASGSNPAATPYIDNGSASTRMPVDVDRRYAKIVELHTSTREDNIRRAAAAHASSSTTRRNYEPILSRPNTASNQQLNLDSDAEPDIIIQHRDGGIVQELPPPYMPSRYRNGPPHNDGDVPRL